MPYQRRRNIVNRHLDGRQVNVARHRGQLFVCAENCCCGRTEDGFAPVPVGLYHEEWERRRLRNLVHLTIGGCLGPCALANVNLLLFDGVPVWLQSMNSDDQVLALYDYVEQMLEADRFLPPPPALAANHFTASTWQPRPDGQPVDDYRPRRVQREAPIGDGRAGAVDHAGAAERPVELDRLIADDREVAAPRKNGELVFEAPWQGRAFGMAIALQEGDVYEWEDFRQRLIATIAECEARDGAAGAPDDGEAADDGASEYYERWLASLESVLAERGVVIPEELDERTYQFEFGERDEVF